MERQRREDQAPVQASQAIQSKLAATGQILSGVVGLFDAATPVSRAQFTACDEALTLSGCSLLGIQGVGFTRALPADQRTAYEQANRAEGLANVFIRPPEPCPFITAITLLEPFDWRNRHAFGVDMWPNPVRHQAMDRAMDTGRPICGRKVFRARISSPGSGVT